MKRQLHIPTCRVYLRNNFVNTLSTNQVPQFYCLFGFRDLECNLELFKGPKQKILPKYVSPQVSPNREGHIGQRPSQVGAEGARPTPPWPIGPTLVPNRPRLGDYGSYKVASSELASLS
jgi:hypothetical protein